MTIPPLIILAGGFGTRLRSAVPDLPKALAPVAGRPFLAYLLDRWLDQGVRNFVFTLHHQAEHIQAYVEREISEGCLRDCSVTIVIEDKPLGTGGAVLNAMQEARLMGDVLVANADTWLDTGIQALAAAPAPAIIIVENPDIARFGSVAVDGGTITGFAEKSAEPLSQWINGGVYKLNADVFDEIAGRSFSIEQDVFPRLAQGGRLTAVPIAGAFIDIGVPADYQKFLDRASTSPGGRP